MERIITYEEIDAIVAEFKSNHTKNGIIERARLNNEFPFGYVIDWLKDRGIPKPLGWHYAIDILNYFDLNKKD